MGKTQFTIENAKLSFPNFEGRAGKFNKEGERSFAISLHPEYDKATIKTLTDYGFNVKPPSESAVDKGYIDHTLLVKVKTDKRPPRIHIITKNEDGKIVSNVSVRNDEGYRELDYIEYDEVSFIIVPYHWEVRGQSGVSAYLKTAYFVTTQGALDAKYAVQDLEPPF